MRDITKARDAYASKKGGGAGKKKKIMLKIVATNVVPVDQLERLLLVQKKKMKKVMMTHPTKESFVVICNNIMITLPIIRNNVLFQLGKGYKIKSIIFAEFSADGGGEIPPSVKMINFSNKKKRKNKCVQK